MLNQLSFNASTPAQAVDFARSSDFHVCENANGVFWIESAQKPELNGYYDLFEMESGQFVFCEEESEFSGVGRIGAMILMEQRFAA